MRRSLPTLFMRDMPDLPMKKYVDITLNFLIAGRDTTANLLAWTLYELFRNPQCLTKLREEIAALGDLSAGSQNSSGSQNQNPGGNRQFAGTSGVLKIPARFPDPFKAFPEPSSMTQNEVRNPAYHHQLPMTSVDSPRETETAKNHSVERNVLQTSICKVGALGNPLCSFDSTHLLFFSKESPPHWN